MQKENLNDLMLHRHVSEKICFAVGLPIMITGKLCGKGSYIANPCYNIKKAKQPCLALNAKAKVFLFHIKMFAIQTHYII